MINSLEKYVDKKYDIKEVMMNVLSKLSRDKKLLIEEYGVNYDGFSYILKENELVKQPYNLLAYGLHCDDVIGLMDI